LTNIHRKLIGSSTNPTHID